MDEITNAQDVIDSRDVIKRIEELQDLVEENEADEDEREELKALKELAEQGECYGDWNHGTTLVNDAHFEEHAKDFAENIGAIKLNEGWPLNHINWETAGEELKQDYIELEFDGVSFWMIP